MKKLMPGGAGWEREIILIIYTYRRVLECRDIYDKIKAKLEKQYNSLNSAELKRKISRLQDKFLKLNALKQKVGKDLSLYEKPYEYIPT